MYTMINWSPKLKLSINHVYVFHSYQWQVSILVHLVVAQVST
jgi:hypothetical protein